MKISSLTMVLCVLSWTAATSAQAQEGSGKTPDASELKKLSAQFATVDLKADISDLPAPEKKALAKIIEAAKLMDPLFLEQSWAGNLSLFMDLQRDTSALGKERLQAFLLHRGPWLRTDHEAPSFIPGVGARPEGGNLYPAGSTKAEIEAWLKTLPEAGRQRASGFFTTIRKGHNGMFVAVPYSLEYQNTLMMAAKLLREAADLTEQPTLKNFLTRRATAFLNDDYYASDVAWMELDAPIEPVIGPYEVYEDGMFGAKAAFQGFVTLRDEIETAKVTRFSAHLQDIENNLPIDAKYKNPRLGAMAPIRVVNSLFSSGDGNRGVQTAAFNLPNDERVTREKGTKRVMLKNVQDAKFQKVLVPISQVVLPKSDQRRISFDAFFTHILMHELMHGLGPHQVELNGKKSTPRAALQELYSGIEEAKADVTGLFALQYLIDKGVIDKKLEDGVYDTYLASSFRTIRFGIGEAHGKGQAMQLNYLLDKGAVVANKDGTFRIERTKIKDAVKSLAGELLTIEGEGSRAKAEELMKLATIRPETQKVLEKLGKVPVDIRFNFTTADSIVSDAQKR